MAATTTTANFSIAPEDGWVAVTPANVTFFRIRGYPDKYVYYVTAAATTPSADTIGYRVDCKDFWSNVAVTATEMIYVRAVTPAPDKKLRIDVFYTTSA